MFYKDIYIGTVPICYRDMKSCVAGMFNQPYHESAEFLDADTMQIYQNQQMEEQGIINIAIFNFIATTVYIFLLNKNILP